MIRSFSFFLAVLVAGGLIGAVSQAADVTVRAINGKTGHPLVGYPIEVYAKDRVLYPHEHIHLLAKADAGSDGTAAFHLDQPLPEALYIYIGKAGRTIGCTRNALFSIDEVLRSGVVGNNRCDPEDKIKLRFPAKAGEVVLFARKKTFLDSL